jgi:hypothetical protein
MRLVSTAVVGYKEEGQQNIKQKYSHQQRDDMNQECHGDLPAILMNILYFREDESKERNKEGIFVNLRRDGSQVDI